MVERLRHLNQRIREKGTWNTVKYAKLRIVDSFHEWRMGITTRENLDLSSFGINDPLCHCYCPTDYTSFRKVMKHVNVVPNTDVFLDFGSGLGRTIIMAGFYPFKRIIGVELVPELIDRAICNIERVRTRLKCKDIELVHANAVDYVLPLDVTVIYFFSPFSGAILSQALDNVRRSWLGSPRKLSIIFKNPPYFETEALKHPWLSKRAEYSKLSEHKYVIYEPLSSQITNVGESAKKPPMHAGR